MGWNLAANKAANSYKSRSAKVHLTRYADDFICTGLKQAILEESIRPAIAAVLKRKGSAVQRLKDQDHQYRARI